MSTNSPIIRHSGNRLLADFYNGLQRLAYTGVLLLGIVMVLSGLAIYKPVQLHPLTLIFGGYDGARLVHLAGLGLLAMLVVVHIVLVSSHPRELLSMTTGGKRDSLGEVKWSGGAEALKSSEGKESATSV